MVQGPLGVSKIVFRVNGIKIYAHVKKKKKDPLKAQVNFMHVSVKEYPKKGY